MCICVCGGIQNIIQFIPPSCYTLLLLFLFILYYESIWNSTWYIIIILLITAPYDLNRQRKMSIMWRIFDLNYFVSITYVADIFIYKYVMLLFIFLLSLLLIIIYGEAINWCPASNKLKEKNWMCASNWFRFADGRSFEFAFKWYEINIFV